MNTLEGLPILTPYKKLLTSAEKEHARAVLRDFFSFYEKDSPREYLWFMLVTALTSNSEMVTDRHRSDMIFFYEYCVALFKAAQVLCDQGKKSSKSK